MVSQDRTLTCAECNSQFIFSADDQQFHREKLAMLLRHQAGARYVRQYMRFFEQAAAGRMDLLGRRPDHVGPRVGEVLSTRWIE